jgi:hypothetical protein
VLVCVYGFGGGGVPRIHLFQIFRCCVAFLWWSGKKTMWMLATQRFNREILRQKPTFRKTRRQVFKFSTPFPYTLLFTLIHKVGLSAIVKLFLEDFL